MQPRTQVCSDPCQSPSGWPRSLAPGGDDLQHAATRCHQCQGGFGASSTSAAP